MGEGYRNEDYCDEAKERNEVNFSSHLKSHNFILYMYIPPRNLSTHMIAGL